MVAIETVGGARMATIRGERLAMIELEDVLRLERKATTESKRTLMVIRASAGQPYVLGVEAVESNEELVIRPASPIVAASGVYAGMTLPDNGQPMLLLDATGLAQRARLPLKDADAPPSTRSAIGASDVIEKCQALLFRDRDGQERMIPLAVIDRVEDIDASRIAHSSHSAFVHIEERLIPVVNAGESEQGPLKALRLHSGDEQLCYLIEDVVDILEVPAKLDVKLAHGHIAGLALVDDRQLEVIDAFTLFAEAAARQAPTRQPIRCLIADDGDPWMRAILAPLLIQAGHEVGFGVASDLSPDVVICGERPGFDGLQDVPVVALRTRPDPQQDGPPTIYRYDRDTILAAIAAAAQRAA